MSHSSSEIAGTWMYLKRSSYLLLSFLVLTGALYAGYVYLAFNYLLPHEHLANSKQAERQNTTIWATGFAKIFTVQAQISLDDETETDRVEVVYGRKIETAYEPLKRPPKVWNMLKSFSQQGSYDLSPSFEISEERHLSFEYRVNPYRTKVIDPKQTEILDEISYARVNLVRKGDPKTICTQTLKKLPVRFGRLTVQPLSIEAVRYAKVRQVVPRELYGYADRSLQYHLDRQLGKVSVPSQSEQYFKSNENNCWGQLVAGKLVCVERATKACAL